ncbi:MAG TPA: MFS transporter [Candidatus Limnocylindrales bacterium]|nr:MFS transporter [Candidatus Limnocylindrales bacterium]
MRTPVVLSCYWLACLAALGTFFPLYSLYLSDNLGLSGWQVGLVLSVIPLVGMFAQPVWGAIADHSGSRTRILTLLQVGTALGYAGLHGRSSFGSAVVGTAVLAMFSTSVMPMSVSVSLALLRENGPRAFGIVRSFGTLGYLLAVAAFPLLLHAVYEPAAPGMAAASAATAAVAASDAAASNGLATSLPAQQPAEPGLGLFLWVAAGAMTIAALISLLLPRTGAVAVRAQPGDWRRLARNGPYVRLLIVMLTTYAFLHGPLVMFPMFVRSLGGGVDVVSHMWLFMLVFEIPLLAMMGGVRPWLGARELVAVGIGADGLRWLVCALSPSLASIYAAQVLHGVAVAGVILGSAQYVEAVVPARLASTAQGLVYMMGVSLGGIVSTLIAGALVDRFGPTAPALFGGIGATVLVVALPWILPRVRGRIADDFVQQAPVEATLPIT